MSTIDMLHPKEAGSRSAPLALEPLIALLDSSYSDMDKFLSAAHVPQKASNGLAGRPQLEAPNSTMSEADLNLLIAAAQSEMTDLQLKTQASAIDAASQTKRDEMLKSLKKLKDTLATLAKRGKPSLLKKIFGWIEKIVMVIVAAIVAAIALAAAAVTGGASLAIAALAIMLLTSAITDLASHISEAAGGPTFSTGELITKAVSSFLQDCGMEKEKADEVASKVAMAIVIVAMLVAILCTCGTSIASIPGKMRQMITSALEFAAKAPTKARDLYKSMVEVMSNLATASPEKSKRLCKALEQATEKGVEKIDGNQWSAWADVFFEYAPKVEGVSLVIAGSSQIGSAVSDGELAKIDLTIKGHQRFIKLCEQLIAQGQKEIDLRIESIREINNAQQQIMAMVVDSMSEKSNSISRSIDMV